MTATPIALVTGAGAPTGMGMLRSLKRRGLTLAAADISEHAPGRILADLSLTCPPATSVEIDDWWQEAMAAISPDYVISTITGEVRAALAAGAPVWASHPSAIDLCEDKYAFAEVMAAADIPHPATGLGEIDSIGPWCVKPRFGEGSRDTFITASEAFVGALCVEYPDMIVQQAVDRDAVEWEVDVIAENGKLAGGVAFFVHRRRGGTTMVAETFPLARVARELQRVIDVCDLDGPLNIGGFLGKQGVTIIEVNPRFSHGALIAEAAGCDLIGYYLAKTGEHQTGRRLILGQAKAGLWFSRYYSEMVRRASE